MAPSCRKLIPDLRPITDVRSSRLAKGHFGSQSEHVDEHRCDVCESAVCAPGSGWGVTNWAGTILRLGSQPVVHHKTFVFWMGIQDKQPTSFVRFALAETFIATIASGAEIRPEFGETKS